ncbi:MAG: hypothetical protein ACE5G8_09280 [Anaerolineae bacterium]
MMSELLELLADVNAPEGSPPPVCTFCRQQEVDSPIVAVDWWPGGQPVRYLHIKCAYRLLFNLSQTVGGLLVALADEKVTR